MILGLKMVDPHNSGSTLTIFWKFCTVKGAKRHMKFILVIFAKNIFLRVNSLLWPEYIVHLELWICSQRSLYNFAQ